MRFQELRCSGFSVDKGEDLEGACRTKGGSPTPQRAYHVGSSTAWRRPARPRVTARGAGRARAPTGRAHAQGGAPPLPRGEGVYGEAAAAAAEADAEAVAMAPFPDEVDVFTAPHWRMKQLVGRYCDKVTERGAEGGAEERRAPGGLACELPATPALAPCKRPPASRQPRGSRTFPPGPWVVPSGRASPALRPAHGSGLRGDDGRSRPPGAAAAVPAGFGGPGSAARSPAGAPGSPPQAASAVARYRSSARPASLRSLGRFANTVLRLDL